MGSGFLDWPVIARQKGTEEECSREDGNGFSTPSKFSVALGGNTQAPQLVAWSL